MGDWLQVTDKFTGVEIGRLPAAGAQDVDAAVRRAHAAFPPWSATPAHRRAAILLKAAQLIDARRELFAETISREAGKAWKHSVNEVARSVETFTFAGEEAKRIHGETVPMDASVFGENRVGFYLRAPLGVVSAITPFNFPLNLVAHKVAPALAAGNTVVLKPAEETPLTAVAMADCLREAGCPTACSSWSTATGRSPARRWCGIGCRQKSRSPAARRLARTSCSTPASSASRSSWATTPAPSSSPTRTWTPPCRGASCRPSPTPGRCASACSGSTSTRPSPPPSWNVSSPRPRALKVGNPLDRDCDVGPMISDEAAERAEQWTAEAVAEGATLLVGGRREGRLVWPAVLTDTRPEMKVMCREAFAPLVSVVFYKDFEDALRMLGDSPYGLQAGIYTQDLRKAFRAVAALDVGGILVNDTSIFRVDHMPYGGNRMSGVGREGVRFAVEEMTNLKFVCFNLAEA